ncbi:hypothetical protein MLD38_033566 [Melastoma candidum]|uniref:Uncharacterized protein n=1 Tax=Melastoma candidum TaxID=119954 RepID=A0ACB9M9F9_9MYRT|nr:hypothetical protein MLD38_033566 [Melastoma candidum]
MRIWDQADVIRSVKKKLHFLLEARNPNNDEVIMEKLFHPNLKLLIVKAVDTTGAGDAFVGGFLYCLSADLELYKDEKRLRDALFFETSAIIEQEQLQLKKYIEEHYSKILDVERELANLSMEMKLTAGPKKAALELLRTKIEASQRKVSDCQAERRTSTVHESSNSQFARLEELKETNCSTEPKQNITSSCSSALNATSVPPEPALTSKNRPNGGVFWQIVQNSTFLLKEKKGFERKSPSLAREKASGLSEDVDLQVKYGQALDSMWMVEVERYYA